MGSLQLTSLDNAELAKEVLLDPVELEVTHLCINSTSWESWDNFYLLNLLLCKDGINFIPQAFVVLMLGSRVVEEQERRVWYRLSLYLFVFIFIFVVIRNLQVLVFLFGFVFVFFVI
jgi:hypothetical protein